MLDELKQGKHCFFLLKIVWSTHKTAALPVGPSGFPQTFLLLLDFAVKIYLKRNQTLEYSTQVNVLLGFSEQMYSTCTDLLGTK